MTDNKNEVAQWELEGRVLFQEGLGNIQVSLATREGSKELASRIQAFLNAPAPSVSLLQEGAAAEKLRIEADKWVFSQGFVPDGSLVFTKVAEAYQAGHQVAAALSQYQQERGGADAKSALVNDAERLYLKEVFDCLPDSMSDFLADFLKRLTPATPTPVAIEEGGGAADASRDLLPQPVTFDLPHEGAEVLLYIEGEEWPVRGQRIGLDAWHFVGQWDTKRACKVTHFSYIPTYPTDAAR